MNKPFRAAEAPFAVNVERGKDYYWCACGLSKTQPFCDRSHIDSGFVPVKYSPDVDKQVFFCGCKATATAPLCDGSHKAPV